MSASMTVTAAAEARRSIRSYAPTPIPAADLDEILRVAGLAPSAWNLQPWRVTVVTDPELKHQLQTAAYGQKQVGNAPAVLVIHSDMADTLAQMEDTVHPGMAATADTHCASVRQTFSGMSEADREAWGAAQTYLFVGVLLLKAQEAGYATSPMLGFKPDEVKSLLGLPAHVRIPALVAIGTAAEAGFPHFRHPLSRFVTRR